MASEFLSAAREYVAAGLSVIPIERGGKHPHYDLLVKTIGPHTNRAASDQQAGWRTYCKRMPTDEELFTWFSAGDAQLGIVGGQISGGLMRIDFEHRDCLSIWRMVLRKAGDLFERLMCQLPIVSTPKGHHIYFRMPDPVGHLVLSAQGSGNDIVLAETQGEGCYCVAPPSFLFDYSTVGEEWERRPYKLTQGSFAAIPTFDIEIANQLIDAARFTSFWSHRLNDMSTSFVRVHRGGITLENKLGGTSESWYLPWDAVNSLQSYFERYKLLLHAIEAAPPPPPSYPEGDYSEDYREYD